MRTAAAASFSLKSLRDPLVAVTVLLACACASSKPAAQSRELSVLSWNLLHGADEHGKLNLEAKGEYISRQGAELVFLQEIDQNCRRTNNVDQMAVLGGITGMDPQFAAFMDFQGGRYGLGMLSALPCRTSRVFLLPPGDEPRVALLREIELFEHTLLCIDVHFNWVVDDTARFAQAQALLGYLATDELPCVIAGDFNDRPASRTLEAFYAAGFKHVEPAGPSWDARAPSKDIDHILIRSGKGLELKASGGEILDGDFLSDHRAVRGKIRVSRRA